MTYNWQLWDNFTAAAEELGLELRSTDGGCVYIDVPEPVRQKFYVMCWTPLNKLRSVCREYPEGNILGRWDQRLLDLRQNHTDFHLEFGARLNQDGGMYWFPDFGVGNTPSRDDIVTAVKIMMDTENFEKYRLMALMKGPEDE